MRIYFFLVFMALGASLVSTASDPVEELKSFSDFKEVDLQKLAKGDILAKRGDLMDFPRGISTQTCSMTMAPPEKKVKLFPVWDASKHKELNVYFHCPLQIPPTKENFKSIDFKSKKYPIRWLVEKTASTTSDKSALQISRAEASQIFQEIKANTQAEDLARDCWINILMARVLKFQQQGVSGLSPYEMGGTTIDITSEIQSLLKENSKVAAQFLPLLSETPFAEHPTGSNLQPYYYCDLLEVSDHATFNLGVIYIKPIGDRYQILDCCYYSSGGFYASFTLRQLWPIKAEDKPATLVWRGDFLSAPSLTIAKGLERMAFGAIMLQEVKKAIRCFRGDVLEAP